jgi:hypothetical protein
LVATLQADLKTLQETAAEMTGRTIKQRDFAPEYTAAVGVDPGGTQHLSGLIAKKNRHIKWLREEYGMLETAIEMAIDGDPS